MARRQSWESEALMTKTTPMLDQYRRLKAEHPTSFLFFRLGDFYELFEEDAVVGAPLLDVQLTSRDGVIPMCGVPHHALDLYLKKLVSQGKSVAIAEQVEDPASAKGLVDRKIVRLVSPGTYISDEPDQEPSIAAVYRDRHGWGLAVGELGTGRVYVTESDDPNPELLIAEWDRWKPTEFLTNWDVPLAGIRIGETSWFRGLGPHIEETLAAKLGTPTLTGWGLKNKRHAQYAWFVLWRYLETTQHRPVDHLDQIEVYDLHEGLELPPRLLSQLDIIRNGGPSLYSVLNQTVTPMGGALLRIWLQRPLNQIDTIQHRHQVVRWAYEHSVTRTELQETMAQIGDLGKRMARITLGYATPRDLGILRQSLDRTPRLDALCRSTELAELWPVSIFHDPSWDTLRDVLGALQDTLPTRFEDGDLIRDESDTKIAEYRRLVQHQRETLVDLERQERDRTGLRTLKVGYHRSFGYYWEVSHNQSQKVPSDWIRRQTMTHVMRYTSDSLRQLEQAISEAEDLLRQREQEWVKRIITTVLECRTQVLELTHRVAELDVLLALAAAAADHGYQSPVWQTDPEDRCLHAVAMRHPVLETLTDYVPQDISLNASQRGVIITGPNMGGKSTFMRALALNVILSHIGSMVAATHFQLPPFDGLYARMGADDDIMRGQSTFMVEMEEMAWILRHASTNSLVLLDELGRGTSTFDGMAIARAVLERLGSADAPWVLFATHYHELTDMTVRNQRLSNLTVEVVSSRNHQLVFTHRIVPGVASQSYGVDVAQMAGIPQSIIARARHYLTQWETAVPTRTEPIEQVTLFAPDPVGDELRHTLEHLDVDALSPRDAWQWVAEWHHRLTDGDAQ